MKTKSLLLGSAAALFAVTGARAADVIIPEPEMVEYVRVCDAAGTGYFYIPGTETCLKIGGYVRFQIDHVSYNDHYDNGDFAWADWDTKASLQVSSWTDSELGPVTTFIEMVSTANDNDGGGKFVMDAAYLAFAGIKMGYFGSFLDSGINGEVDTSLLNDKFNSVQYTGSAGAVAFGVQVDQLDDDLYYSGSDDLGIGVQGMIGFTAGAVDAKIIGFYDIDTGGAGLIGRLSADAGPGTLQVRGIWQKDQWTWYNGRVNWDGGSTINRQWTAEASYAMPVGSKTTVTPGFSYHKFYEGDNAWIAGVTLDHKLTSTLAIKANVEYTDFNDDWSGPGNDDWNSWGSFLRFQASF
jgi:hypothetical protein